MPRRSSQKACTRARRHPSRGHALHSLATATLTMMPNRPWRRLVPQCRLVPTNERAAWRGSRSHRAATVAPPGLRRRCRAAMRSERTQAVQQHCARTASPLLAPARRRARWIHPLARATLTQKTAILPQALAAKGYNSVQSPSCVHLVLAHVLSSVSLSIRLSLPRRFDSTLSPSMIAPRCGSKLQVIVAALYCERRRPLR